ncbi:uncharacterized protein LOC104425618 [Eucalyptus grandis]|uniref:uncharacterized protein LOC104425618 n=1 Tax=Eucalyptus grandis TaxID=71139 RepID=UPI00192EE30E|nr:uncharacterized protein LOC104425618 [Eucalyptus grandis]
MVRSTMVVGSSFCALKIELLRAFQTNQRVITSSSFSEETGARWSPLGHYRACRWGEDEAQEGVGCDLSRSLVKPELQPLGKLLAIPWRFGITSSASGFISNLP